MNDNIPRLPAFLSTLVAGPGLTAPVSTLWALYRLALTRAERRKARRRDFVEAIKAAGAIGIDWNDRQQLVGFAVGKPPELTVDPVTRRISRT